VAVTATAADHGRARAGYINTLSYRVLGLTEATTFAFFVYAGDVNGYDTGRAQINATTLILRTNFAFTVRAGRCGSHRVWVCAWVAGLSVWVRVALGARGCGLAPTISAGAGHVGRFDHGDDGNAAVDAGLLPHE
jgi:hypothetical protein